MNDQLWHVYAFFAVLAVGFMLMTVPVPALWRWLLAHGLYAWTARLRCRIITDDSGAPYLERYFIGTAFGCVWYLHRFTGSDPDRRVHNHPWPWAMSLVLRGSYREVRARGLGGRQVEHRVRCFNWIRDNTFHRVLLLRPERFVWTLFVHRHKVTQVWGFDHNGALLVLYEQNFSLDHWRMRKHGRVLRLQGIAYPSPDDPTPQELSIMRMRCTAGDAPWWRS